ncbi:hypothetical protein Tco_1469030, partial [Tanacetum coccineum]
MLLDSIFSGPFKFKDITIPANEETGRAEEKRMQTLANLTPEEKTRMRCDIKVANNILQGIPNDIYTLLNHMTKAYDIWYRARELMEGTKLTKQERESKMEQNEADASEVRDVRARFLDTLALIANTYNPPPSYSSYTSQYNPQIPIGSQQQPCLPQQTYKPPHVQQQPPVKPTSPDS